MIRIHVFILFICELFLSIDLIASSSSLPSQCSSYTPIDDASRNINAVGSDACDTMFMSGSTWVRFTGASGTELITTPSAPNRCGTQVTGWYAGNMPPVAETITNGRVCFVWESNICQWSNTIAVTNCGSFYVYQLTMPPICSARYCTDTPNVPTTVVPTTVFARPPQCIDHTTIDDPTRNINQGSGTNTDSSYFSSGSRWVRFVGTGGTQIPTSSVSPSRCGTSASGWYSGGMPDVVDTTVNGTVCYSWSSNSCAYSNQIQVTNCGSYYVYNLPPSPTSNLRYCTETPAALTTTMQTTTSNSMFSSQCSEYTTINDPTRNVNQGRGNDADQSYFSSGPQWVRFEGEGGTQIPTSAVAMYHCGTSASGWYSGTMPNVPGTTVNGTACFTWNSGSCQYSNQISVTNCGSYYVYYLSAPTTGGMRYCTDTPVVQTTTSSPMYYPQCSNYTTINDPTRNINHPAGVKNDGNTFPTGQQWVRFEGTGGTQIPTSPVPASRCDTYAPGWYSGEMPSVEGTTLNGTVCYTWNGGNCSYNNQIQVTNCGSYYVYNLRPNPVSGLRYCTETPAVQTTTSSPMYYPQCSNYTTINDPTRNVNHAAGVKNDGSTFPSGQQWVRFEGEGGTQIPTSPVPASRCDTYAPGWYSGEMPSVEGTTLNGTVCYTWNAGNCSYNNQIQVTNCGSYYVYNLRPTPVNGLRYCTDTPAVQTTTPYTMSSSQCYNYTTIDDPTRNINQGSGTNADQTTFNSGPQWVRFVGSGGTEIPTSRVPSQRCGTNAAGWYSGLMPTAPDTTTSGTACFTWTSGDCVYNNQISVTNCGSYYVYQLSAPSTGGMRYCTTNSTIVNAASGSTTGLSSISNFVRSLFNKLSS